MIYEVAVFPAVVWGFAGFFRGLTPPFSPLSITFPNPNKEKTQFSFLEGPPSTARSCRAKGRFSSGQGVFFP